MRAGLALAIWIGTTLPALAGGGFDIVIPGRPGVPIIINGIDASYAVIEGEWGLGRGEQVQPTIYGGRYVDFGPRVGHYYPSAGRVPGYGRLEIEPPANRELPPRAPRFHHSWSAESAPLPAQLDPPYYPPPIIYAPQGDDFGKPHDLPGPSPDMHHRIPRRHPH